MAAQVALIACRVGVTVCGPHDTTAANRRTGKPLSAARSHGPLVVVTGESGGGKTSCCLQLVREARRRGLLVSGLLTLALYTADTPASDAGMRSGGAPLSPHSPEARGLPRVRVAEDLRSGQRRPAAHRVPSEGRVPGEPLWRLRDEALAWGDAVLMHACPTDVLVVDEIGPLELLHRRGWYRGLWCALAGRYGLAVVVVRPWLVPRLRELWQAPIEAVVDVAGVDGRSLAHDLLAMAATCVPADGAPETPQ